MKKIAGSNIQDVLGLTPLQEGILFHYLKEPGSEFYLEQLCLVLHGEIDVLLVEKAWNFVIGTNEMLRAAFRWEKLQHPVQMIFKKHTIQPAFYDFSAKDSGETKRSLARIKAQDRKTPFNLREIPFRVTLCKIDQARYEMIVSNHHIIYDGWSCGIILKEFFNAYHALVKGQALLKPVKTGFNEFVHRVLHQDKREQAAFWHEYLQGVENPTRLPITRSAKAGVKRTAAGTVPVRLAAPLQGELEDFIKKHKMTMASFVYTAWGILLQRYTDSRDVIFGTTVSGRATEMGSSS